jgi:hypothetical protein
MILGQALARPDAGSARAHSFRAIMDSAALLWFAGDAVAARGLQYGVG